MIDVYIAELPNVTPQEPLLSAERQSDVERVSNERARREKYYVWRLLEYAIKNSLGADASRLYFTKGENRRWSCEGFEFSLSHSGSALAVAITVNNSVGVDVERIKVRNTEQMADYILTPAEQEGYDALQEFEREAYLINKWCEKEAIFKSWNEKIFPPKTIETKEYFCKSEAFELCDEKYIYAVSAKHKDEIRVFRDIKL